MVSGSRLLPLSWDSAALRCGAVPSEMQEILRRAGTDFPPLFADDIDNNAVS